MSVDQLDRNEKASFLEWRRALAAVEDDERLTLTPFEKNLEIWRQLWRVCERSDIVVQVVDARDPLFYRCPDLEQYITEIDPAKRTILLLNKADLLSPELRRGWCDYFDEHGMEYLWWSAKTATEEVDAEAARMKVVKAAEDAQYMAAFGDLPDDLVQNAAALHADAGGESDSGSDSGSDAGESIAVRRRPRAREDVLTRTELMDVMERLAESAAGEGARLRRKDGRVCVGMVGYPNVGKSSTVNALVAAKKTGVSATPGKTKHFQTLELGDGLLLADCPGLVFPSFTASRAELVCNGVLPIDRLTDVREPVGIVASRISRQLLEATYRFKIPLPALHENQSRDATAGELLRAYCAARGLTVQQGRPDEQRAGRAILKDFINGKLLHCVGPDGYTGEMGVLGDAIKVAMEEKESSRNHTGDDGVFNDDGLEMDGDEFDDGLDAPDDPLAAQLLKEMMDELGGIGAATKPDKPKRAEHKFQKKGAKIKGRIKNLGAGVDTTAGGDGFKMGKRGGMMPASAQAMVRSSKEAEM
jgi:large subunit GTPase 1